MGKKILSLLWSFIKDLYSKMMSQPLQWAIIIGVIILFTIPVTLPIIGTVSLGALSLLLLGV